jgi:hypothetical protein
MMKSNAELSSTFLSETVMCRIGAGLNAGRRHQPMA